MSGHYVCLTTSLHVEMLMADFDLFNYANKNHLFSVDIMFILFTIEVLLLH